MSLGKTKSLRQVCDEIFPKIDVKKILDYYEVEYTIRGDECVMKCPFHEKFRGKVDRNPSFSVNIVKKLFSCWSCPAKGNIYQRLLH